MICVMFALLQVSVCLVLLYRCIFNSIFLKNRIVIPCLLWNLCNRHLLVCQVRAEVTDVLVVGFRGKQSFSSLFIFLFIVVL